MTKYRSTEKYRASQKKSHVKRRYGITVEEYDSYFETPCDICKEDTEHLDHCHATKKIRGGLCRKCNLMLGYARDNTDIMRAAIKYLEDSCTQKNT